MEYIEKVIKGLEFTKEMITFNPSTGEDIEPGNLNEVNKTTYDACVGAIALLKEKPHWIPTEERLPKSMINKVIVYVQHKDLASRIGFGHFEKYHGVGTWWDLERDEPFIKHGFTVTHWMPIPKSPYGEELILS